MDNGPYGPSGRSGQVTRSSSSVRISMSPFLYRTIDAYVNNRRGAVSA